MNDTELEQNLKTRYQKLYGNPPAAKVTWSHIAPHLTPYKQKIAWWKQLFTTKQNTNEQVFIAHSRQFVRRPVQRIGIALMVLVVGITVIAATSYAATGGGLLSGLFNIMGVKPIEQQFSDYHQSKSINGYTFTIQKAYADTNRVIIGFTYETPTDKNRQHMFGVGVSKLTTEQGTELPSLEGLSNLDSFNGTLFAFDASSIQGTPKELHLHLEVSYGSQPVSAAFHVEGSLTFAFSVPFHPGKILNLNRAVTASGKSVTMQITTLDMGQHQVPGQVITLNGHTILLKRVVISPSETRAYIQGIEQDPFVVGSILSFEMTVNGRSYPYTLINTKSAVWPLDFEDSSLSSQKGVWTLTIQQTIEQFDLKTRKNTSEVAATWEFKFTVE